MPGGLSKCAISLANSAPYHLISSDKDMCFVMCLMSNYFSISYLHSAKPRNNDVDVVGFRSLWGAFLSWVPLASHIRGALLYKRRFQYTIIQFISALIHYIYIYIYIHIYVYIYVYIHFIVMSVFNEVPRVYFCVFYCPMTHTWRYEWYFLLWRVKINIDAFVGRKIKFSREFE